MEILVAFFSSNDVVLWRYRSKAVVVCYGTAKGSGGAWLDLLNDACMKLTL